MVHLACMQYMKIPYMSQNREIGYNTRLTRTPQRAHPMTEDPEERYYSSFDVFKDHKKYDAPPTHTSTA